MKTPFTFLLLAACFVLPVAVRAQSAPANDTTDALYDKTFIKVEIESEFPGGTQAWLKFLNEHLVYPRKAIRKNLEGTVVLQFIVDKDGNVTQIKALSGDPILQEAALKAMTHTPKWSPALQGGRPVKSYKKQPIVFKLS